MKKGLTSLSAPFLSRKRHGKGASYDKKIITFIP